jgi:NTP pyrophosphatase (non-canonical NTP hydrolase)
MDYMSMFLRGWKYLENEAAAISISKGWKQPGPDNLPEKIALMHSELSEALEYARIGNPESDHLKGFSGLEEEFADTIIRIMHVAQSMNLRVAKAIQAKLEYNKTRPQKHGGKLF